MVDDAVRVETGRERAESAHEGATCACSRCGASFRPRKGRNYCSASCRARASQQRKADEIAEVLEDLERLAARLPGRRR